MAILPTTQPTFETLWQLYSSLKPDPNDVYRYQKYIAPAFKDKLLQDIVPLDILYFRQMLEKENLSPQTVKHYLAQLRRILNKGKQWEVHSCNLPYFEMPRFDNKRERFLTKDEVEILLVALNLKSELWCDISKFALHTGLRAGEIFHLRKESINLTTQQVQVFDTKTSFNRAVNLNSVALGVAQKYVSLNNTFLFPSRVKNKSIQTVSKTFFRTVEACGFNDKIKDRRQRVVFHTLRHTFASWLIQAGEPIIIVSRLLGHKSLEMTMRYAHLTPNEGATAVQRLVYS